MKTKIYLFTLLSVLFSLSDTLQAQQQTITIRSSPDWEDALYYENNPYRL